MEATDLVPRPGSVTWRYAGDARLIATGAHSILLQVAHPTVGAGVTEHSGFRADPWGRLLRTLDYFYVMVYGGPEAAARMGNRIRDMHREIRGVRPDGRRYHALEPEAYAWVHATLADSLVRWHQLFGRAMEQHEIDQYYAEWRRCGELVGVLESDLPDNWPEFREYLEEMVEERLQRTAAVDEVLEALEHPADPRLPFPAETAWRLARTPANHHVALITGGLLRPALRELFGIEWSRGKQHQLRLMAAASRAATPLLPPTLRNIGPRYLHWRREAISRGDATTLSRDRVPA